jgi:hypothetical protein
MVSIITACVCITHLQTTRELHSGPDARYRIPQAPDIQIKRPNLAKYRVFVQSKSQGSRCLRAGDVILYNITNN